MAAALGLRVAVIFFTLLRIIDGNWELCLPNGDHQSDEQRYDEERLSIIDYNHMTRSCREPAESFYDVTWRLPLPGQF